MESRRCTEQFRLGVYKDSFVHSKSRPRFPGSPCKTLLLPPRRSEGLGPPGQRRSTRRPRKRSRCAPTAARVRPEKGTGRDGRALVGRHKSQLSCTHSSVVVVVVVVNNWSEPARCAAHPAMLLAAAAALARRTTLPCSGTCMPSDAWCRRPRRGAPAVLAYRAVAGWGGCAVASCHFLATAPAGRWSTAAVQCSQRRPSAPLRSDLSRGGGHLGRPIGPVRRSPQAMLLSSTVRKCRCVGRKDWSGVPFG